MNGDRVEMVIIIKIRWNESKTPCMCGHMHINVWIRNYVSKLPKTRRNMMFEIRRKFKMKYDRKVVWNE